MPTLERADRLRDRTHKTAVSSWIAEELQRGDHRFVSCTLTLKQALPRDDGTLASTSKQGAERAMDSFLDRLDRAVYRSAARRHGLKLARFGSVEGGAGTGKRLHLHLLIEHPDFLDFDAFEAIIRTTWQRCPLSMQQVEVQPVVAGTVGQIVRYFTKTGTDAICVGNMELACRAR
jgi:hypothetical protein